MILTVIYDPTVGAILQFEQGPDGPVIRTGARLRLEEQINASRPKSIIPACQALDPADRY